MEIEDVLESWLENDYDQVDVLADLSYHEDQSPADTEKGDRMYRWRVNVLPSESPRDSYQELVGPLLEEDEGKVKDIDKVLEAKDQALERANELEDYLQEEGLEAAIYSESFENPEYNFEEDIPSIAD